MTMQTTDNPTGPKYPDVVVELSGQDGNAFMILGVVQKALWRAGLSREKTEEFVAEATSGDYDHLLRTAMAWVTVT